MAFRCFFHRPTKKCCLVLTRVCLDLSISEKNRLVNFCSHRSIARPKRTGNDITKNDKWWQTMTIVLLSLIFFIRVCVIRAMDAMVESLEVRGLLLRGQGLWWMTWIFGYRLSEYPGRIVVFFKLVAKRSGHQSHSGVLIFSGDLSFPARNAVEIKFHKEPDRQAARPEPEFACSTCCTSTYSTTRRRHPIGLVATGHWRAKPKPKPWTNREANIWRTLAMTWQPNWNHQGNSCTRFGRPGTGSMA